MDWTCQKYQILTSLHLLQYFAQSALCVVTAAAVQMAVVFHFNVTSFKINTRLDAHMYDTFLPPISFDGWPTKNWLTDSLQSCYLTDTISNSQHGNHNGSIICGCHLAHPFC